MSFCAPHAYRCPQRPEGITTPWSYRQFGVPDVGCWEPNPSPLKDQRALLTTEPLVLLFGDSVSLAPILTSLARQESKIPLSLLPQSWDVGHRYPHFLHMSEVDLAFLLGQ